MLLPHSKTRVGCLAFLFSPFLPVMRVQSRRSRKGFGHSWLVANSSKILPSSALVGLAGDTVHNPILNPTLPESDMLYIYIYIYIYIKKLLSFTVLKSKIAGVVIYFYYTATELTIKC